MEAEKTKLMISTQRQKVNATLNWISFIICERFQNAYFTRWLKKTQKLTGKRLWLRQRRRPRLPRSGISFMNYNSFIYVLGKKIIPICGGLGIKFCVVQVWAEYPGEGELCHNGEDHRLDPPGQGTHKDWCRVLQGDPLKWGPHVTSSLPPDSKASRGKSSAAHIRVSRAQEDWSNLHQQ